jgi:hypothetical protein
VCARVIFEKYDWRPMEDAPFDEDVELLVTDAFGSFYGLRYRCRRTAEGWVSSASRKTLKVTPVQWKPVKHPAAERWTHPNIQFTAARTSAPCLETSGSEASSGRRIGSLR